MQFHLPDKSRNQLNFGDYAVNQALTSVRNLRIVHSL